MAASLGLGGHEAYPPAASLCFPPDLAVANNCAATANFLPSAAAGAEDCFPEFGAVFPPSQDYYDWTPHQVFAENEMSMRFVDAGRRRMVSAAAGTGGNGCSRRPSSRIGFRTRSEVDVLDDGFRWRKYGKKAVKSSPNPRNYYRCSVEGCGVKKRVERDRDDPRYVVTTYDGVHNHAAGAGAGAAGGHHNAPAQQELAPYAPAGTVTGAPPPPEVWGTMQLHAAAAMANSSESSY